MKRIRDMKALARESLLDKYGTVIGAYFLSGLLIAISALLAVLNIVTALANTKLFESAAKKVIPSFKAVPALTVVGAVFFTAFVIFTVILTIWLKFGREKLLLNICRGEKYGCADIFYAFKSGTHPWRVVGVRIVGWIFIRVNFLIPLFLGWAAKVSGYNSKDPDIHSPWFIAILVVNVLVALWTIWLTLGFTYADTIIIDRPETGVLEALKASLDVTKFKKLKLFWMVTFSFIFWYILISIAKLAALWVIPYIETTVIIFYLCARGEEFVIPANKPVTEASEAPEAPAAAEAPVAQETVAAPEAVQETVIPEDAVNEPAAAVETKAPETVTEPLPVQEPAAETEAPVPPAQAVTEADTEYPAEEVIEIDGIPAEPLDETPAFAVSPAPMEPEVPKAPLEAVPEPADAGTQTGEEIIITEDEV